MEIQQKLTAPSIDVRVIGDKLCVAGACTQSPNLGTDDWLLITLRVINGRLQLFVDATKVIPEARIPAGLDIENIYVGSAEIPSLGDEFYLYDIRYYQDALTSSEIDFMVSGMLDPFLTEPSCKCPSEYPDSNGTAICTDGKTTYPRFNSSVTFNNPDVLTDGSLATKWATPQQGSVTFLLDLGLSYEINSIQVNFDSEAPPDVTCVFGSDGSQGKERKVQCANKQCHLNLGSLDSSIGIKRYEDQTTDMIQIVIDRESSSIQSYIVSSISIKGRCDCHGSASQCSMTNDSYTCQCKKETNTFGMSCLSCVHGYFRHLGDFDCSGSCQCNLDGVVNATEPCEEIGGACVCKDNVDGLRCDSCKTWTWGLNAANPDGCKACLCDQNGAFGCNNKTGECNCKNNTVPGKCDRCLPGFFGLDSVEGCKACNCNTPGTVNQDIQCDAHTGKCPCKDNVQGKICTTCKDGSFDLSTVNAQGCTDCKCHLVGSIDVVCDKSSGQCPCRGDIITDRLCTPRVTSVTPLFGPLEGGTLVTVQGVLLGNATLTPSLFIGDVRQDVVSLSDEILKFKTKLVTKQATKAMKLSWKLLDDPLDLKTSFDYRGTPTLSSSKQDVTSFTSGGCLVTLSGKNLKSVKSPKLRVQRVGNTGKQAESMCKHAGGDVVCGTPDVGHLTDQFGYDDNYEMMAVFDGVTFSDIGKIEIVPDPVLDQTGTVEFQYPFETTITLSGKRLLSGCQSNRYAILLGTIHCDIEHISDTQIECSPPKSPPKGIKSHVIKISIGNIQKVVGTMKYLEFYETTGFIIIISCISALIVIVVGIVIFCCCCKARRNTHTKSQKEIDHKNLVPPKQSRVMNEYAELSAVNTASANGNGFIGGVYVETVIKEPKRGIVNTSAEDAILMEEFLPHVEPGLREEIRLCYVGRGHFNMGRTPYLRGKKATICDGTIQKNGTPLMKLTIKCLTEQMPDDSMLPAWANEALSECLRLRRCSHTHILSLYGVGVEKQRFYLLYPHMAHGTLKTMISDDNKEFSVRQLLAFSQQAAEGILFLATKDMTHKDVAARNCFVDEYSIVKLTDSSLSWNFFPDEYVYDDTKERYLPLRWMAPESINDGYYDNRTDVWSFAVLVWELLTRGCLPFHEVTGADEVKDYITQGYILGKPDSLSDEVYNLLKTCWTPENESRPRIAAVARKLSIILESDDDETYANADVCFREGKPSSPRAHNSTSHIYSTTNLSCV